MKKRLLLVATILCSLNLLIAQPGHLDSSFGSNGVVRADLGKNYVYESSQAKKILLLSNGSMYVVQGYLLKRHADGSADESFGVDGSTRDGSLDLNSAAIQADGKIVVAGAGNIYSRCCATDQSDFAVARYNTDGSPDKSFGADGKQFTDFGTPNTYYSLPDRANSVALQKNGKIVVAGIAEDQYLALARYNEDGSPDSTFESDGKLINKQLNSIGASLAIQDDGKILVAGNINGDFAIARYNTDGTLDHTFSDDGIQTTDFDPMSADIASLAIQSDGKIIAAGSAVANSNYSQKNLALARYNADGSLDKGFSSNGKLTTDVGISNGLTAMALQSDGKIVAIGDSSGSAFLLVRYNVNGSLDKSFSNDGKQVALLGVAYSVAIQANGKIVAAGSGSRGFAIWRYNNDGSADDTFDEDGKLTDGNRGKNTVLNSTAIQKDGKIVVVGSTWNGSNFDFAIARFNTNGSPDNTFGSNGVQTTDFASKDNYANAVAIQNDGKIVVAGNDVARYNTDGSLDKTFSEDGILQTAFGDKVIYAYALAIQSDRKIVVAGDVAVKDHGYYNSYFAVARYNIDGSADKTFDQDGLQTVSWEDEYGEVISRYATSVVIQNNGKIVVAGLGRDYDGFSSFAILNADGSLEKKGGGKGDAHSCSLALQKDGKIVMQTYFRYRGDDNGIQIDRYNADGSPDTSFNGTGQVVTRFESWSSDIVNSVAIQNDNKIVVGGTKLFRYNTDGSIDSTFGSNGIQTSAFEIKDIAISGNKLYAAGSAQIVTPDRPFSLSATVGLTARFYLDNDSITPPTVSLTAPANNATYLAPAAGIKLSATASDDDGTIGKVEFYNGTHLLHTEYVSPYGFVWRNVPVGNYTLTAKAYDTNGLSTTSAPVHISVVPNKAPIVSIIEPSNNQSFAAPGYIHIEANAADSDGRVVRVEFYNGPTLIRTEYQTPYTYNWQNVSAGTYTITAVATDNWGAYTTSVPVTITVTNAAIVSGKPSYGSNKTTLNEALSLRISPNPATNVLNISTTGLQLNKPITISVISASGVVMKTMQVTNSTKIVQLDVSSIVSGAYTLKLISGSKITYKQFVKL